jgi:hypothetical protein
VGRCVGKIDVYVVRIDTWLDEIRQAVELSLTGNVTRIL